MEEECTRSFVPQSNVPVVEVKGGEGRVSSSSHQPRLVRAKTMGEERSRRGQQKSRHGVTELKSHHSTQLEAGGKGRGVMDEGGEMRGLDRKKMVSIVREYGEYPSKYRAFIWRSLLQLPANHTAYSALLERGAHSAYTNLHRDYPIRSQRLSRVLQRYATS